MRGTRDWGCCVRGSPAEPALSPVRPRSLTGRSTHPVDDGWELATVAPGAQPAGRDWIAIGHRTTVAGALRRIGRPIPDDLDSLDHWFRVEIPATPGDGRRATLELDGVATICEVRWNGEAVASSASMFSALTIDVTHSLRPRNVLELRCASLTAHLGTLTVRRARWKTRLVAEQRLRAVRTTMLGRIPSWCPSPAPVGPWRPVRLVLDDADAVAVRSVRARRGSDAVELEVDADTGSIAGGRAHVGPVHAELSATGTPGTWRCEVPTVGLDRWWPHTHGVPARHEVRVELTTADGRALEVGLGATGIRDVVVDRGPDGRGFTVLVEGTRIFCRGGSLMPIDVAEPDDDPDALRARLVLLRDAGLNMVRLSGVGVPASTVLLDLCDELGFLLWHDLPLANLDHPATPELIAAVTGEVHELAGRAALHASLAVVCGGSEIEQQAAMMGTSRAVWADLPLVDAAGAALAAVRPDLAWVRSSPTGGHLPFVCDEGPSHWFGVGAYRRPLSDARASGVRFASECLAVANVPSPRVVHELLGDAAAAPTDPRWKAAVPRDRGAGWDFDDVRDHYAGELLGVDVQELRWTDPARYLAVGRAVSAELMARVLAELRRSAGPCDGALVWFLNDLVPGAGWGVLDAHGMPKSALDGLTRSCAPIALLPVDEGLNGLDIWVVNDTPEAIGGTLEVASLRDGRDHVARASQPVTVPARSDLRFRVDELYGRFTDPTCAYGFGPPAHDVVAARLLADDGTPIAHTSFVPAPIPLERTRHRDVRVDAVAAWDGQGRLTLEVSAQRFARCVSIDAGDWFAWPDHVDVAPGMPRRVELRPSRPGAAAPRQVHLSALNGLAETSVAVPEPEPAP